MLQYLVANTQIVYVYPLSVPFSRTSLGMGDCVVCMRRAQRDSELTKSILED